MNLQTDLFGEQPVRVVSVDQDAFDHLIKFKNDRPGQPFSSEQVTISAAKAGIEFSDARSWGAVFTRAAAEKHIRRSDKLFARQFGNGTLAPGWVGI